VRDLTDRKRAQEELHKRDEQLRHSQKLEALGTLAGGVAHEFNNLLQAIQGYTRYAREGLEPSDPRRLDLELVLKATERAVGLTRQLLGFSRRQILQYADLDPNQIVRDAVDMLRPLIGEHIHLEVELGEDIGTVHADPTHLQQLLMNLSINARDAMPTGGRLLIKTESLLLTEAASDWHELPAGRYLCLTVADTGCGMTPEVLEHAFDPFFTTKEVGQGTGLGLASVYGVVTQHRGTVRVHSDPGKGTSFKILLPVVERPPMVGETSHIAPRARDHETVLLAEDEPLVSALATRALEAAGYRVICAADGAEALAEFELRHEQIALVMLDVVMPRLNGREVYQRMRQIDPHVKVIFSSAYDLETAHLGFIGDHGLRFVQKPCEPAELLQTVRDVIDAPRAEQPLFPSGSVRPDASDLQLIG
jgi:nitrogen-specific signal transduction histidine kinase/ActR/RegA family two-component response regulator